MLRDHGQGSPGELAAMYLRQIRESGEEELILSPETASLITGVMERPAARGSRTPAATTPAAASTAVTRAADGIRAGATTATTPAAAGRPAAGTAPAATAAVAEPDSVRAKAAALPEPEVVDVRLALGHADGERDMFVAQSPVERCGDLECVSKIASVCRSCELASTRTNVVFGAGNPTADLMFIGEGPGRNEDLEGVPFVGRAGELLNKILEAAEFIRDDVYIANIIKCRPPNNRTPLTSEIDACVPFLARQIALIKPRIICTLGLPATQTLLGVKGSMGAMRGKVYRHGDIKVIPTYHPAAALRDPKYKRPMWEDFLLIRREYDRG
jgi:uracil-DNA glycosylase family 4